MSYANSAINPFLYAFTNDSFKSAFGAACGCTSSMGGSNGSMLVGQQGASRRTTRRACVASTVGLTQTSAPHRVLSIPLVDVCQAVTTGGANTLTGNRLDPGAEQPAGVAFIDG